MRICGVAGHLLVTCCAFALSSLQRGGDHKRKGMKEFGREFTGVNVHRSSRAVRGRRVDVLRL
ncbi:hypothetical protein KCP73_15930 [Salmonella enterica subsp. enterica]|nr:hypothetical protein KCP73_15930 [Salmonella enterica subsp. enterica]